MRALRSLLHAMLATVIVVSLGSTIHQASAAERDRAGTAAAMGDRATSLTLRRATRGIVVTGSKVPFTGTAPKARAGNSVTLQRRVGRNGKWVSVARSKVGRTGNIKVAGISTGVGVNTWRLLLKTNRKPLTSAPTGHRVFAWYYLSDREPVQSLRFTEGGVRIGGRSHPNSVLNSTDFWWENEPWAEWNLSYRCARFEAEIGLTDDSASDGQVNFLAALDGAQTNLGTKSIGPSTRVVLDTTSRLRLRLTDQYVAGPAGSGGGHFWGAWGSARVLCSGNPG